MAVKATDNNKRFTLSRNSKNLRRETQRQYLAVKEWRSLQHAKSLPLCPEALIPNFQRASCWLCLLSFRYIKTFHYVQTSETACGICSKISLLKSTPLPKKGPEIRGENLPLTEMRGNLCSVQSFRGTHTEIVCVHMAVCGFPSVFSCEINMYWKCVSLNERQERKLLESSKHCLLRHREVRAKQPLKSWCRPVKLLCVCVSAAGVCTFKGMYLRACFGDLCVWMLPTSVAVHAVSSHALFGSAWCPRTECGLSD